MSITTDTRREAHEAIMPQKPQRYALILEFLRERGDMTAEEITDELVRRSAIPSFDLNAARPRLTELKEAGRVQVIGKRASIRSGRKTAVWAIKEEGEDSNDHL